MTPRAMYNSFAYCLLQTNRFTSHVSKITFSLFCLLGLLEDGKDVEFSVREVNKSHLLYTSKKYVNGLFVCVMVGRNCSETLDSLRANITG